ncbi:hypothetical protein KM043_016122 [Ampulex compressa]|nr:hypothetical protein KM043_016122 [Ampulex compressa]
MHVWKIRAFNRPAGGSAKEPRRQYRAFTAEVSLVSNNSRGATFPEHPRRPFVPRTRLASWNFHTLEEAETKRGLQDFGGFGWRLRRGVGGPTMSRDPRAHCAVSPPPPGAPPSAGRSAHPTAHFCRQCEKRSWRDPRGIPRVESIDAKDSLPGIPSVSTSPPAP